MSLMSVLSVVNVVNVVSLVQSVSYGELDTRQAVDILMRCGAVAVAVAVLT